MLLRRTLYLSNSQEQRRTQVDFLVPCTTVTAFSAYIFPIYTHTTNCKRKRERRSGGASLTPSGMHAMRATTLETCAIPHARPCRAASGCTRHDANKTHAVATLQRRAREDMIVQAEPNTMLPELEFEREHRVKMITSICYILQLAIYDLLLLKIKELALTSLEIIFRKCT